MSRPGLTRLLNGLLLGVLTAAAAAGGAGAKAPAVARVSASVGTAGTSPHLVLSITRNGAVVYTRAVRATPCAGSCTAIGVPPGRSPVHVLDLDGDRELDVVLGLFTGGANCCVVDQVFTYDRSAKTYVSAQHNFSGAGAALVRLGGRWVFRSGDSRIAQAGFTDVADSGAPIQIWRFRARRFTDVTRTYPALIRADAAKWLGLFDHDVSNGVGLIAAWAADEDLLGQSALVDTTLRSLAAQHKLRTPLGLPHNSETTFVAQLEALLRKLGYSR
ncbi:MAG: hypothetical protein ACXVR1_11425 [Solirubrobacteraceae bacterium]